MTWISIVILQIPTKIYHLYIIRKAIQKIQKHAKLKVIAITGSYGKTSTKEYLASILKSHYRVLKTDASKNSPIGIAETILQNLREDHEIFVVEMGAYKEGEITKMCQIVHPQIGIVTAVNAQHQDLFGSIETTKNAKYELLSSLQGVKIAIVNNDNPHTAHMGKWAIRDGKNLWVYTEHEKNTTDGAERCFYYSHIDGDLKGIKYRLFDGHNSYNVHAGVLGDHQAMNVTAAIVGAVACGMDISTACLQASELQSYSKTMKPLTGYNDALFINDTFNNNPDAAKAAIKFLSKLKKGKKYLVFQPMIELGSYAHMSHRDVGELAGKYCDEIIITNNNFFDSFISGVNSVVHPPVCRVLECHQAADRLRNIVTKQDVVLFKGKEAEKVLEQLV